MADFKTYLESLVLAPKDPTIYNVDDFPVPYNIINFLYMVRDHYIKYQTVDYLFCEITTKKTGQLGTVEYLKTIDAEVTANKFIAVSSKSISARLGIPNDIAHFIYVTLFAYTLPNQALTLNYISNPDDANMVYKRVDLGAYNIQVLQNGVNVTIRKAPSYFENINGTIYSPSVMPTPTQIINIIDELIKGAYTYYTTPVKAPELPKIIEFIKNKKLTLAQVKSMFMRSVPTGNYSGTGYTDLMITPKRISKNYDPSNTGVEIVSNLGSDFMFGIYPSLTAPDQWQNLAIEMMIHIFGEASYPVSYPVRYMTGTYSSSDVSTSISSNVSPYPYYVRVKTSNTSAPYWFTKFEKASKFYDVAKIVDNYSEVHARIINSLKMIVNNFDFLIGGTTPSKNSWITSTIPSSRFRTYLNYFTSGKITLEYLKAIQVQDKILATDLGKDLYLFPAFLILSGDTSVDPYDSSFLRINSSVIKTELANVISYIVNQLFAQDINLLNNIGLRFKTAIDVNEQAKTKLREEQAKLALIDSQLQAQLIEAKKVFTAYEVVMNNFANNPDPVIAYQQEMEAKMKTELDQFQAEQVARINNEIQLQKEQVLRDQLALVQQQEQQRLVEQAKQAEIDRLAQEQKAQQQVSSSQTMQQTDKALDINYSTTVVPISVSEKATTISSSEAGTSKKSTLPLVAGVGLLALLALGNKDA
jgi:hypothetical protein